MHFISMVVQLCHEGSDTPLTVADSVFAHAAVLRAISGVDADAGRTLHDMKHNKLMTLAIVRSSRQATTLRVTFVAEAGLAYANMLVNALSVEPTLRLGRRICNTISVNLSGSNWCGISNWVDLTSAESGRYFKFKFVTPTAFTKRDNEGQRFISPLPTPSDVFSGLAKRWQAFSGESLPDDLEQFLYSGGCVISDFALRRMKFRTAKRTQIGFTGWAVYECRKSNQEYVKALNWLTRLAFFTGVGYQTARGMGAVQTRISN